MNAIEFRALPILSRKALQAGGNRVIVMSSAQVLYVGVSIGLDAFHVVYGLIILLLHPAEALSCRSWLLEC